VSNRSCGNYYPIGKHGSSAGGQNGWSKRVVGSNPEKPKPIGIIAFGPVAQRLEQGTHNNFDEVAGGGKAAQAVAKLL
jgi:hypothetical protein